MRKGAEKLVFSPKLATFSKSSVTDYSLFYLDTIGERMGYLRSLEVKRGNMPFGSLRIGDSISKLRRELGDPENECIITKGQAESPLL